MNILWVVNIPLPEASQLMKEPSLPYGGWLVSASKKLSEQEDVKLSILFPFKGHAKFDKLQGEKITYYACSDKYFKKRSSDQQSILDILLNEINPDLVHIFGTELPHSSEVVNCCNKLGIKFVISIQGLVSVIAKHINADLPLQVIYGFTLRNLLLRDSVNGLKRIFYKRGKLEVNAIQNSKYIIGRTEWDKACTKQINPTIEYFKCNETLRESFYSHKWSIDAIERNSIFLSQAQYSLKGLHKVLDALPIILAQYPDTKVYVSGKDIFSSNTLKDKFLRTYYAKFINKKINKLNLNDNVIFIGSLDEKAMCERYLKSHVFICPSSLENSPNSLGEAMLLGVPSIASYVGGTPDLLTHNVEGYLYHFDAEYMIAHYVLSIFSNDDNAKRLSNNAREKAAVTHNAWINQQNLNSIYQEISESVSDYI